MGKIGNLIKLVYQKAQDPKEIESIETIDPDLHSVSLQTIPRI